MNASDQGKIFFACCLSLVVTAMTFAIRAGILGELSTEFTFSDTQLGWINSMAFLGFPVATMLGGLVYNHIGAKNLLLIAFVGHVIGLLLTIFSGGFWGLLVSTFCIGFANGSVEAGANPLIADMYHDNKTTMLNRFHVWFPGGIVIGALVAYTMTNMVLNPAGVLLAGSVVAAIGIYLMSSASGGMVYVSAILFAIGVMYFWPTMLGFISEYQPRTGALGLSLIGGLGMFSVSIWNPVIGNWIDTARQEALASGLSPEAANLAAGQATLSNLALFPLALIVLFGGLYFYMRKRGHHPERMEPAAEQPQL